MKIPLMMFDNIDEIRLKRVKDNIFSIKINSSIKTSVSAGKNIQGDYVFEAKYCIINSPTILTHDIHSKFIGDTICKSYELPLNIELLEDSVDKEIFKIISKNK